MKNIAVFCGSNYGVKESYHQAANQLGTEIARRGIRLIYGGANVGLMKILADAAMLAGGEVHGFIPVFFSSPEIAHMNLTNLTYVADLQERKKKFFEHADGYIALPGGFGTLDELSEVLTFNQLDLHSKPVGILNTEGFFNHYLDQVNHMVEEQFLKSEHRDMILIETDPALLLEMMFNYKHIKTWKLF